MREWKMMVEEKITLFFVNAEKRRKKNTQGKWMRIFVKVIQQLPEKR